MAVFVFYLAVSCCKNGGTGTGNNKTADTSARYPMLTKKQLIFKKWLADTVNILNSPMLRTANDYKCARNEIIIASDSLGLTINHTYNLPFDSISICKNYDVNLLLSAMKEYDESPRGRFDLELKTEYFFSPSPVSAQYYDMIFDFEDIRVIEQRGKKVTRYEIVRGRMSSKHVTTVLIDGSKKEKDVDFIWDNKKLIKQEVN